MAEELRKARKRPQTPEPDKGFDQGFFGHKKLRPEKESENSPEVSIDEYIVSECQPVNLRDRENIIREIKLSKVADSITLTITLDKGVPKARLGLINSAVCHWETIEKGRLLGLKISNDSKNEHIVRVTAIKPQRAVADFTQFLAVMREREYLSKETAKAVLSLLKNQPQPTKAASPS